MARFGIKQWTSWEWKFWALVTVPSGLLLWFSIQQLEMPYETSIWFALTTALVSFFFFAASLMFLVVLFPSSSSLRLRFSKTKIGAVSIREIGPSLATRLTNRLLSIKIFRSASDWMADSIEPEVIKSGMIQSPSLLAEKYFAYATIAIPVCTALAIILAVYVSPLGALVIFAPALIAFMPRVSTRVTVQDRNTQTDKELGTFLIYAAEQQSAGGHRSDLLSSFESIIPTGLFKQLKKEAEKLVRDVHLFTRGDYLAALEKSGMEHPNRRMKDVLIGYVSESRTGGDVATFLESTADEAFKDEQFRWKMFAERVSTMGEVIVMSLLLFPAAGAVMGAVAGGSMGTGAHTCGNHAVPDARSCVVHSCKVGPARRVRRLHLRRHEARCHRRNSWTDCGSCCFGNNKHRVGVRVHDRRRLARIRNEVKAASEGSQSARERDVSAPCGHFRDDEAGI